MKDDDPKDLEILDLEKLKPVKAVTWSKSPYSRNATTPLDSSLTHSEKSLNDSSIKIISNDRPSSKQDVQPSSIPIKASKEQLLRQKLQRIR
jgi:hypothetical protein